MNRVTLIGIAGLIVLAAAIALNYWNGREPGEEPVVAEPTKASAPAEDTSAAEATAPAAPQEPSPAEASSEVAESSPTQEGAADSEGEDEGAPSGTDPSTADSLSGQGTAAAQPASPGDDKAPTAGPTTPSEPSAAAPGGLWGAVGSSSWIYSFSSRCWLGRLRAYGACDCLRCRLS